MFVHTLMATFFNHIFNTVSHSRIFRNRCFRREGSSWTLLPMEIVEEKKPREVTMQLAILSGLPSAIEIHILEESLETMRVGELGWGLGTRNFVWLLCGLIHKPKNVATISYALSSQNCDAVDLREKTQGEQHLFSRSLLDSNPSEAKTSNYWINYSNWEYIIWDLFFCRS